MAAVVNDRAETVRELLNYLVELDAKMTSHTGERLWPTIDHEIGYFCDHCFGEFEIGETPLHCVLENDYGLLRIYIFLTLNSPLSSLFTLLFLLSFCLFYIFCL